MKGGAERILGDVFGGDCVDHVRSAIVGGNGRGTRSMAGDLADLLGRLDRVHSLSGRFSGIRMSPDVEKMVELADVHRLAV